jgi:molecular chaperone HtpG
MSVETLCLAHPGQITNKASRDMTETATTQKHAFQAEVREVLHLMVHSLYSNKEIFLRELISNASDACDKLRFESLQNEALLDGDGDLKIEIEIDKENGQLIVRDNGIGMSFDEVTENIGTIARSGTRQFLEQVTGDSDLDRKLIGQFGVGFYSSFIVADQVTVLTRRAGAPVDEGVRWSSDGAGEYEISSETREAHGTEVILHLKESEAEFLQPWTLRALVTRYSDHIGFPIRMQKEGQEHDEVTWEAVNQASALWTLPKSDISDEEYQGFYKHLSHDLEDALAWTHNVVEGNQNYTNLLYVPSRAPLDIMLQRDERQGLRLYVRRVFIMDAAEQLLPHYLRFIRGVVDSDDLPLNVSRELLQENRGVAKIRAAVVKRSLDLLVRLADQDPEKFVSFWDEFGAVLKEGIVEDMANRDKIAGLLRFSTTHDGAQQQRTSLADYIARMPEGQDTIWYITSENHQAALNSPHLEIFRKKGIEVLLMSDRIDEWMMGYFTEFEGKRFQSVAKGEVDLDSGDKADADDKANEDQQDPLLEKLAGILGEKVSGVRASKRLTNSASCLVFGEQELALHMRQLLQQAGQELPDSRPVLEINTAHPLYQRLSANEGREAFDDLAHLLHEQAVLSEGGQLDDPAAFVQRMNRLMVDEAAGD